MLVKPLPGVDRAAVLQGLEGVLTSLRNTVPVTGGPADQYNAYIKWVDLGANTLRHLVQPSDVEALVLTKRYWVLQSLVAQVVWQVGMLVDAEVQERIKVIADAVDALKQQIYRWSDPGWLVVPDTSLFIEHASKLEELDFADVLGARGDRIRLVIPMVVIDELDKRKTVGNDHKRWRAGYSLAVIDRVLQVPTGSGQLRAADFSALDHGGIPRGEVRVEIAFDPPGHVRQAINDDEIVDRAVAIQTLAGRDVTLITFDTGHSTRGRAAGLKVKKLDQPRSAEEPPRR